MTCPIIIQTCDKYEKFWDGLFKFMSKHWDSSIGSQIFFCNEESEVDLPSGYLQIRTGKGSFVQNLKFILNRLGESHVFYMLEDFWPTAPMGKDRFEGLHKFFLDRDADAVQVSSYLPYYSLRPLGSGMFEFHRDSEWIFNFQARFWKSDTFIRFLTEPDISESVVGSAITAEMASDKSAREQGGISAYLNHYLWYPISGVSYRGDFTEIGKEMQNVVNIDRFVDSLQ